MLNGLFYLNSSPIEGISGKFLLLSCFKEIPVFNVTSVDPDQRPHSAASDQGLHSLLMSFLWNVWHKWVSRISQK